MIAFNVEAYSVTGDLLVCHPWFRVKEASLVIDKVVEILLR